MTQCFRDGEYRVRSHPENNNRTSDRNAGYEERVGADHLGDYSLWLASAASGKVYESGFVFQRGPFSRGRRSTPGGGAGRIGGDPTGG